jgi:hypothetical protein
MTVDEIDVVEGPVSMSFDKSKRLGATPSITNDFDLPNSLTSGG